MSASSSWGVGTFSVAKFHQGLRTGSITRTKEADPQPGDPGIGLMTHNGKTNHSKIRNGISQMETREKKQQDKEYETGYLEHYVTYRKGKGGCRRNEKV